MPETEELVLSIRVEGDEEAKKKIDQIGDSAGKLEKTMGQQLSRLRAIFLGIGMSMLFLGMQIAMVFTQISRQATDTFLKIRASAGPTNDAISALNAGFEFLKYTIGDAIATALEPLLPFLLDIVESVADWIEQNPELVSGLIMAGIAIGVILMMGGQLLILFSSLIVVMDYLAVKAGASGLAGVLSGSGGGALAGGLVGAMKGAAIAAGALLVAALMTAGAYDALSKGLERYGVEIPNLSGLLTSAGTIIVNVILIIFNALSFIFGFLFEISVRVISLIVGSLEYIDAAIKSGVAPFVNFIMDSLIDILFGIEKTVIESINWINKLIMAMNAVLGTHFQPIDPTLLSAGFALVRKQLNDMRISTGELSSEFENANKLLGMGTAPFAASVFAPLEEIKRLWGEIAALSGQSAENTAATTGNPTSNTPGFLDYFGQKTPSEYFSPTTQTAPAEQTVFNGDINFNLPGDIGSKSKTMASDVWKQVELELRKQGVITG